MSMWPRSPRIIILASLLLLLLWSPIPSFGQTQAQPQNELQADLDTAAAKGNISEAKRLIKGGANVNGAYLGGVTPLMEAAWHDNNAPMIRFLIESGADVNARDGDGRTALLWASSYGYLHNALTLMQAGADVNASFRGHAPLSYAIANGHTDVVLALLKDGAKLELSGNGPSALALAAWGCHADTARALLDAGAKLSPTDWNKDRPPQFSDFPVQNIYRGKSAAIDFSSNPKFRAYHTRLKEAASGRPSFAGHYIVTEWGCGSNCQSINFLDARNGKIFDGVGADRGADYRLDSELFIENPAQDVDAAAYDDDPVASVSVDYYVMRDGKLDLIYSQACKVVDEQQHCGCENLQKLVLQTLPK